MSIAWCCGKLGAAYYDIASHEGSFFMYYNKQKSKKFHQTFYPILYNMPIIIQLHVIPDVVESSSGSYVLEGLFFQLQPHTVIIKHSLEEKQMAKISQLLVFFLQH